MSGSWWPLFWAAVAVFLTGAAAYGSNMLMRLIDQRVEQAKGEVLDELDMVEQRLALLEQESLSAGQTDPPVGTLDSNDLMGNG